MVSKKDLKDCFESEFKIYKTTNYDLFKFMHGNRQINELHRNRLMQSLKKRRLFSLIVANRNFEIIDGQHRFVGLREMKEPIHFIIIDDYGLDEIRILNSHTQNWTPREFLKSYCDLGYNEYRKLFEFMDQYDWPFNEALRICTRNKVRSRGDVVFSGGTMIIGDADMERARWIADKIRDIKSYCPESTAPKHAAFIAAFRRAVDVKGFKITQFMDKVKKYPFLIQRQRDTNDYIVMIEKAYNYNQTKATHLRMRD